MSKNYYKRLSRDYFEATLTERQERRLLRFLSRTDDPAFDEARAVAGFFAAGRSAKGATASVRRPDSRPWVFATVAAGVLAVAVGVSVWVNDARKAGRTDSLAAMESTLTTIFSSGADVEAELSNLMTQDQ